jgi:predicted AAA+ superfamily ATPase
MNTVARPLVIKEILESLETSDKLVFLVGPRGSGKTTLLQQLIPELGRDQSTALIQIEPIAASPEILCERFLSLAENVLTRTASRSPSYDHLLASLKNTKPESLLLLDELTELRTLSYFPGVKKPLDSFIMALTGRHSPRCVATSRFSFWLQKYLETLPESTASRIRILHLPPLTAQELQAHGIDQSELLAELTGGLPAHVYPFLDRVDNGQDLSDGLLSEISPGGRVEAECRATLGELLHRARGYGACKAVLSVLASEENLTLSEIARKMKRTAGSTRDYLRWLEEVDLIEARKKRYTISAPLIRLWLRLYTSGFPPSDGDIRNEVEAYLSSIDLKPPAPTTPSPDKPPEPSKPETEKMIEID